MGKKGILSLVHLWIQKKLLSKLMIFLLIWFSLRLWRKYSNQFQMRMPPHRYFNTWAAVLYFGGNFRTSDDNIQNQLHLTDHRNVWASILTPPDVDHEYYQDLVSSNVQYIIAEQINSPVFSRGLAIKKIKEIHKEIILEISKKDKSVNSNIEQHVIKWWIWLIKLLNTKT